MLTHLVCLHTLTYQLASDPTVQLLSPPAFEAGEMRDCSLGGCTKLAEYNWGCVFFLIQIQYDVLYVHSCIFYFVPPAVVLCE